MKTSTLPIASLVLGAALTRAQAPDIPLAQQLKNANTASERISLLKDENFVFDFTAGKAVQGAGGKTISANIGSFPALFSSGIAMTLGFMQPCSLNSPHTHPRATEVLLAVNGTLESGFLAENGARFVMNTIEASEAAIFPRGSIHFQANTGCKPVFFVATLNNEDPGTLQIAQNFFGLPSEVVGAVLGGLGVEQVEELAKYIPDNLIQATDSCFAKCNLPPPAKGSQPTAQQRTPVPLPTGGPSTFEGKGKPNTWFGSTDGSTDGKDASPKANSFAAGFDGAEKDAKGWFADIDGTKIALLVLVAVNIAAVIGALVFVCVRAAKRRKLARTGGFAPMATTAAISAPRPLMAGTSSSRGKYAAAAYELPHEDHSSTADLVAPRAYDDPYDRPPSRGPTPVPVSHQGPYHD